MQEFPIKYKNSRFQKLKKFNIFLLTSGKVYDKIYVTFFHRKCNYLEYRLISENNNLQSSYGIEVLKRGERVRLIPDMGSDKRNLEKLVELLNEMNVEPRALDDIIEDYLTFFDI